MKKWLYVGLFISVAGPLCAMELTPSEEDKPEPMELITSQEEILDPIIVLGYEKFEIEEELRRADELLPLYFRLKALHELASVAENLDFELPKGLLPSADYEELMCNLFSQKYEDIIRGRFPGYMKLVQAMYDMRPNEPDEWNLAIAHPTKELPAFSFKVF